VALIVKFGADATYQLPAKGGDVLVWTRLESILGTNVRVVDVWALRGGALEKNQVPESARAGS
jgi:hypothetical protein